jgi:ankyrin repeat protein
MTSLRRLLYQFLPLAVFSLMACKESMSMKPLDASKYFSSPAVAAFVDDVQNGDVPRVKQALAHGVSANAPGIKGFRPIHFVYPAKDAEVLKLLLSAGADPMARVENGNTPLHFAVRMPNPDFTHVLLAAGADANAKGANNKPVLQEALSSRQPENLRSLARAGADVNVVWGGATPLMAAIVTLSWDMAAALLDLNADLGYRDDLGEGALDAFCETVDGLARTATNRNGVLATHAAFKRRGVAVPCEAKLQKFR